MSPPKHLPFWSPKLDSFEAAQRLREYFADFADVQSDRRALAERYASVTEGMTLSCLGPWGYSYDAGVTTFPDDQIPIIKNLAYAVVDTLTSKIGAIDPPLPAMLTNKGSWKDRRQAEDLQDLVRAEYASPKGIHSNLHEVWIAALRLAAGATGTSAVHYYDHGGTLGTRIHDTLDMAWSPDMRTQACFTWMPVEDACELWPDSEADIVLSAGEPPPEWRAPTRKGQRLTDFVCVYEGWRGASGSGEPGVYVAAVNLGDALERRPYPHRKPPFVWLPCIPHMYGPLAHSLVHHVYESMRRANLIRARVDRAISKTNLEELWVDQSKIVNAEVLSETEDRKIVLTNEPYEPARSSAPGFAPEHISVANMHEDSVHDVSGLAQSHTAGIRQEGVDSAIGQRYVAALVNERFAALQRRYVQAVAVDSAEVIVQVLCDIYENNPRLMRLAPGQDTLREVSGSVALKGIESVKYVWQPAAVSGNKGNPADRMQTALELKQLGVLSDSGFAAMQGMGFDLPEELDDNDIERQWVERQMHRWQFASDEEIADPDFYRPPFEHMKLGQALILAVQGYLEAEMDDLEPERLDFFLRFIADCAVLSPDPTAAAAPSVGAPPAPPGGPTIAPEPQIPAGFVPA